MAGLPRSIELPSLHAAEFGVGMVAMAGLMLVLSSSGTGDWIIPGDGLPGMSGVASGKAEGSVSAMAGDEVHEPAGTELPSGAGDGTVPVALALTGFRMTAGTAGDNTDGEAVLATAVFDVAGMAGVIVMAGFDIDVVPVPALTPDVVVLAKVAIEGVAPSTDGEITCAVAGEQFKLVPAMVGSCARGTGASVVTGAFGSAAAE